MKLSHERKVRSLAKKTLGSTRVGRAMRLPGRVGGSVGVVKERCCVEEVFGTYREQSGVEVGLT